MAYRPRKKLPSGFVCCPYNSTHTMPEQRLQWHVAKCSSKAKAAPDYTTCPYNASHIVLKSEISHHVSKCKDRELLCGPVTTETEAIDKEMKKYVAKMFGSPSSSASDDEWQTEPEPIVGDSSPASAKTKSQRRNLQRKEKRRQSKQGLQEDSQPKPSAKDAFADNESTTQPTLEEGWSTVPLKRGTRGSMGKADLHLGSPTPATKYKGKTTARRISLPAKEE